MINNPFSVSPPENLKAKDVQQLFVDVFSDFEKVPDKFHTFVHGARGTGKSMMFRYLQPDCQMLTSKKSFKDLDFFAILVPIKKTAPNLTELSRLGRGDSRHAENIFNEHFLSSFIAVRMFEALETSLHELAETKENKKALHDFCNNSVRQLLLQAGYTDFEPQKETITATLAYMRSIVEYIYAENTAYLRKLSFAQEVVPYDGSLFSYHDFLIPLAYAIRNLPFTPNGPIYLMLDDADNLSKAQTMILNSWVNTRSTEEITLKISTQLKYKTKYTTNGLRIDNPHDYSEVNISDLYTNESAKYKKRIYQVVKKRLEHASIKTAPEDFFPSYKKQDEKIEKIKEKLNEKWKKGEGRGNKPNDDSLRYAIPEYITSLGGKSKSQSKYYYAGFDQLVHISSGIMRWFLEPAYHMYAEEISKSSNSKDTCCDFIDPSIQNSVIRERSTIFFNQLDDLINDQGTPEDQKKNLKSLKNLVEALGGLFHQILISNRSERRVFSIALSQTPSKELKEILDIGVSEGFFHKASIGNKEGTGRTSRYVLHRMLAPHFTLDPSGFAGYFFVTNDVLENAIKNPKSLLNKIKREGIDKTLESKQASLFDEEAA